MYRRRGDPANHIERVCEPCGSTFSAKASEVAKGWGRFCSRACANRAQFAKVEQVCIHCGVVFLVIPSRVAKGEALYCGKVCYHTARTVPLAERLTNRAERHPRFGCLMFTGPGYTNGYGIISRGGRGGQIISAHRAAYELAHGTIPEGLLVCHTCDVNWPPGDFSYRRCIEPSHLFLGTHADNMQDMLKKNRGRWRNHQTTPAV